MVGRSQARVVMVSAVASGQGKTSVTAALARKLSKRGERVRVFKCGPDFIDPMLLERASGACVESLDLWMVGLEECRSRLAKAAIDADIILIEGVMGLYDGSPSSADLAREFCVPVLAVIDASAMAQTAGAVVMGLRDYGPVDIAGVIANRVAGAGHAAMIAASMRGIPLFGTLPRQAKSLPERHLGLVLPSEQEDIDDTLDALATQLELEETVWNALPATVFDLAQVMPQAAPLMAHRTVAVARDAAFCFIYPANLATLTAMGASLIFFSPLADEPVPAAADSVWLPGGYPELHAEALSLAARFKESLREMHAHGVPVLAECGGMMAVVDTLVDQSGNAWPMAGLLPGQVAMQERLAAIGAQSLDTSEGTLRGHTFHYSRFTSAETPCAYAAKQPAGVQGEAFYRKGSLTASYFHAWFASSPEATAAMFARGAGEKT